MNSIFRQILRFVLVILLQLVICNNVHLFGFITPALYIYALLLLPVEMPKSLQYIIGFFCGFIIDMFTHTLGVNAAASVIIMMLRPSLIRTLNGHKSSENTENPIPGYKDFTWLLSYAILMSLAHQTCVVMLEVFSFNAFLHTLLAILGNTTLTAFLILCIEYIVFPTKRSNY